MTNDIETPDLSSRGWTAERRVRFLDLLAHHGNARAAAGAVGLSVQTAYRLRRRDAMFARGWNAALLLSRDTGAQVLAERAIDGVVEDVWHRGELVGTRRRFDTRLLLAHLGRLDRVADEARGGRDAGHFDALLACIAGEQAPDELMAEGDPVPLARDEAADVAGKLAGSEFAREWKTRAEEAGEDSEFVEQEVYDAFHVDRRKRSLQARAAVETVWDGWNVRALATVDRMVGDQEYAPLLEFPAGPLRTVPAGAANFPSGQSNLRNPGGPLSPTAAESRTG